MSAATNSSKCPFAAIVKATAPAVAPKVLDIVGNFYPRMFQNNPEVKKVFNPANQFADPPRQRLALANSVVAYASNIDQLDKIADAVKIIAHKHCGVNVVPDQYPVVHKNLMESVGEILGEVVTPEIGQGWSDAVLSLANILIEEEAKLYQMAESRSGGWSGVKDFKISGMRSVASDCVEFTFVPIDGAGPIDFTPGQFLTLHLPHEGATPRHYTVTNAPGKEYLQCCVKKIKDGFVSNVMHSLAEGNIVGLTPPFGVFHMGSRPAVLVSAGCGATPMKSFLDSSPEMIRFMLHVDKNPAAHPFKAEMEAAAVSTHFHYTEQKGRLTSEKLVETLLEDYIADCDFFLCGPTSFLTDMKTALQVAGAKNVNCDVFGPALSLA
jgi:nitric oxide dioxygenase